MCPAPGLSTVGCPPVPMSVMTPMPPGESSTSSPRPVVGSAVWTRSGDRASPMEDCGRLGLTAKGAQGLA